MARLLAFIASFSNHFTPLLATLLCGDHYAGGRTGPARSLSKIHDEYSALFGGKLNFNPSGLRNNMEWRLPFNTDSCRRFAIYA
ncbi:MAG: hypothetical protein CBB68_14125 [Rhodospirillaceae bacterium TMED8]|nr:hypothetical protein [Magnetovibrio sp.]OUT48097.1 MAG: hypothetical protein CBB68_14125 [Rhodospirillaceae bacterium TMED8]